MSASNYDFTPRAQQALALARQEADRFHHNYVGTEHVLLGLLNLGRGAAVNALREMGLDLEGVRKAVERQVGTGPITKPTGNIPYTPRVKKVLALAAKEAKSLNHDYIGTAHILLGLLREGEGVAARVLRSMGVDVELCRKAILASGPEFENEQVLPAVEIPGLEDVIVADATPPPSPPSASPEKVSTLQQLLRVLGLSRVLGKSGAISVSRRSGVFCAVSGTGPDLNFTPRAQQVLSLARKEADRFHHNYVGTEHLLLGLINLGQGVAVSVLQKLGLDLETTRRAVEEESALGPEEKPTGNIPYTPRVKKVLALSAKEAKALNHSYIGTEHLLLGLLHEEGGRAERVFKRLGMDVKRCREEILAELDLNFSGQKNHSPASAEPEGTTISSPARLPSSTVKSLTPSALAALTMARREADWFHHDNIEPEHLLLALLSLENDAFIGILQKLGLGVATIHGELIKQIVPGTGQQPPKELPYSPAFIQALKLAQAEAKELKHPRIGLTHILLGLLREEHSIAARILTILRVDCNTLRGLCALSGES